MQQTSGSQQDNGKGYWRWAGFGTELCGVLALSCYLGHRLDEALHTAPWLMITGFFVGFLGMLYMIIKDTWPKKPLNGPPRGGRIEV